MSDLSIVHRPLEADELDRWIAGLESGENEQTTGSLRSALPDTDTGKYGYCCLGLKCQIDGLDLSAEALVYETMDGRKVTEYVYEHSGTTVGKGDTPEPLHSLSFKTRSALASANDSGTFPYGFTELAGVLRRFRDDLLAGRSLSWDPNTDLWEVVA